MPSAGPDISFHLKNKPVEEGNEILNIHADAMVMAFSHLISRLAARDSLFAFAFAFAFALAANIKNKVHHLQSLSYLCDRPSTSPFFPLILRLCDDRTWLVLRASFSGRRITIIKVKLSGGQWVANPVQWAHNRDDGRTNRRTVGESVGRWGCSRWKWKLRAL